MAVFTSITPEHVAQFAPSRNNVLNNAMPAVSVNLFGTQVAFGFTWNTKHERYSLDVMRDGKHMRRFYPVTSLPYYIRNLVPSLPYAPDAMFMILDSEGANDPIEPENLGDTHQIFLILGAAED